MLELILGNRIPLLGAVVLTSQSYHLVGWEYRFQPWWVKEGYQPFALSSLRRTRYLLFLQYEGHRPALCNAHGFNSSNTMFFISHYVV